MLFAFYGTLMPGRGRALPTYLGGYSDRVVLRGELYDVGAFPALLPGDGRVHAILWESTPDCEDEAVRLLDRIEGYCPEDEPGSLYLRREAEAWPVSGGDSVQVWTYVWNQGRHGLRPIPSGSWLAHRQERDRELNLLGSRWS